MVNQISIIFMAITAFISFILPFLLWIFFYRRYKISATAVLVGALIFIVFQLVTIIPLLSLIRNTNWYTFNSAANPWLISIFLGVTAGIFEETGRFIGFKLLLKNKLKWTNGIAYGIGHGGIEAILLCGLTYINNIIYSILLNQGSLNSLLKLSGLSDSVINSVITSLTGTPSYMFLIAGVERIFTLILQIALSLILLYAVKKKKIIYLFLAILLHTVIDSAIGFIHNIFLMEGIIAVFSVVVLIYIIRKINKEGVWNEK